jgi:hypothetical protein
MITYHCTVGTIGPFFPFWVAVTLPKVDKWLVNNLNNTKPYI